MTNEERARLIEHLESAHACFWCAKAAAELSRTTADARDARRYRWVRQRIRIRKEEAMAGSKRDALDFRVGHSFVDSKQVPGAGYLDPKKFVAECNRVDEAIDAALASSKSEDRVKPVAAEGGEDAG